jgi:hypothetical protein
VRATPAFIPQQEFRMFKTNAGMTDRVMRAVLGIAVVSLVYVGPQTPWGWLGLIPLATAVMGWCPLYSVFGFNTCDVQQAK